VIKRPDAPVKGKVGIVTGGGSGHLPVFTGMLEKAYSMRAPSETYLHPRPSLRWRMPFGWQMAVWES